MRPNLLFFCFLLLALSNCPAQSLLNVPGKASRLHLNANAAKSGSPQINTSTQDPSAASFDQPVAITSDRHGNYYIGESGHDVRKIDVNGTVTLFAGSDVAGYKDGPRSTALFGSVPGIAIDTSGNFFIADGANALIRMIDTNGMVSTLAGSLVQGNLDGNGMAAKFASPSGITIDRSGNLYVTDQVNNNVRKITPGGLVTTVAGGIAGYADGIGTNASFNKPMGICVDTLGNLFVADNGNNRIRKITPDGQVSTFAGNGLTVSTDSTMLTTGFNGPSGLFLDASQNLYITENYRIWEITSTGKVVEKAGIGTPGDVDSYSLLASFNMLTGVCVSRGGIIYLADAGNQKIREICSGGLVTTLAGTGLPGTANGRVGSLINPNCPSTIITHVETCHLLPINIPNTFTPNNDGINDYWHIKGLNAYPYCEVSVYDRWGQMVFKSKGYPNEWDGTYQGKPVPTGVYYYLISNLCKFLYGYVAVLR